MKLTSSAFQHEQDIPRKYTCDGSNINPPLAIRDVPSQTQSLVLILEDPDVPKYIREDHLWNHWIVFNIDSKTTTIEEGQEPIGTHGLGTGGNVNYYGPCPPEGEHRYYFKIFALDCQLDLPEKCSKQQVLEKMQNHIIEKAELMGVYGRS